MSLHKLLYFNIYNPLLSCIPLILGHSVHLIHILLKYVQSLLEAVFFSVSRILRPFASCTNCWMHVALVDITGKC